MNSIKLTKLKRSYYVFWGSPLTLVCYMPFSARSWQKDLLTPTENTTPEVPETPHQLFTFTSVTLLHHYVTCFIMHCLDNTVAQCYDCVVLYSEHKQREGS